VSEGGAECSEFAKCAEMLANDEDIDYQGVSGPIDFNDTGSPSAATIGLFDYKNNNTYVNFDYVTGEV
jgi:hypothetical protein